MPTLIVVGAQWGDEGKGKIVDLLTDRADLVVRYAGGNNAGHTIIVGGEKFVLHLIPSGILHPKKRCFLGGGMVLDPEAFLAEVEQLIARGVKIGTRLKIAPETHLIMPYHKTIDLESEKLRGKRKIGTTGRGIGPAYVDKVARIGIRVADLLDPEVFRDKLAHNIAEKNYLYKEIYGIGALKAAPIYKRYLAFGKLIAPFVADVSRIADEAGRAGKSVLFEGAQGTMLDIDHGTYPFVTSSSAAAGGVCTGAGVPPTKIHGVLGVSKAYITRVGGGPFATEAKDEMGERIRKVGNEYGAVTGRPRRCGWFDVPLLRYTAMVNGFDSLVITKLDVLDELDDIPVCTAYRVDGRESLEMPATRRGVEAIEPVFERLPGWRARTAGVTRYEDLPVRARDYLRFLQDRTGVEIGCISTGPERDQ